MEEWTKKSISDDPRGCGRVKQGTTHCLMV